MDLIGIPLIQEGLLSVCAQSTVNLLSQACLEEIKLWLGEFAISTELTVSLIS